MIRPDPMATRRQARLGAPGGQPFAVPGTQTGGIDHGARPPRRIHAPHLAIRGAHQRDEIAPERDIVRIDDREHCSGDDGGVDRVAAVPIRAQSGFGCQRMRCR